MSDQDINSKDLTTAWINVDGLIKRVLYFISVFVAIAFLVLFFVCLGGASDASEAKDVYNEVKIESLPLPYEEEDEMNQSSEEKEVKNSMPGNATHITFPWCYTSAAVCFSVFTLFFIPVPLILFEETNTWKAKGICFLWLLLLAVPLAIVPAVRMDGFCAGTYWLFFIPHFVLALALPILLAVWMACSCAQCEAESIITLASLAVSDLLALAGLILWIIRLDKSSIGGVPPFRYALVLLFFALAVATGLGALAAGWCVAYGGAWGKSFRLSDIPFVLAIFAASIFLSAVMFGGFLLPFTLRKDRVFQGSYHNTLIPDYVLVLVLAIVFVCLSSKIKIKDRNK